MEATRLETASVTAFRILERELRAHDAPLGLRLSARRAAKDEVRHARLTATLCLRYGGRPSSPTIIPRAATRSLKEVASENAVEGCVRETFGAVVGLWQAKHARDARTRRAMSSIASDEVRHAELAWAVASWAEPQLGESAQRDIGAARKQAFVELLNSTSQRIPGACVTVAGFPSSGAARGLAERLGGALSLA